MASNEILEEISSNNKIIEHLLKLFGGKTEVDVIKMIAFELDYNLEDCTNHLLDMTKEIPAENFNNQPEKSLISSEKLIVLPKKHVLANRNEKLDRIIRDAKRGIKIMILMRGLPGSGKSHLANKIAEECLEYGVDVSQFVLSTDDFFYKKGFYRYNPMLITEAHDWNQRRARHLVDIGASPIIIDNTHTEMWEMLVYSRLAVDGSYIIEIVEPSTAWAFNCRELSRINKHNVPRDKIVQMSDRYQKNITVRQLFEAFNLSYKDKLPPQPRAFPPIFQQQQPVEVPSCSSSRQQRDKSITSWDILSNEFETELVKKRPCKEIGTNTTYADLQNRFEESCNVIKTNGGFINSGTLPAKYPKERYFDKGTMTDEAKSEEQLEHLVGLFEGIPLEYLKDVYEKCQRNMEWTVELLLDDKKEILENYTPPIKEPKVESPDELSEDEDVVFVDESEKLKKQDPSKLLELKQHIEANIIINPAHYSSHLLKLKKIDPPIEMQTESQPSCSSNNAISIDLDSDFDDFADIIDINDDDDDLVEINLGDYFVDQLENKFGDPDLHYPKGFQPVIEIPKALGRQLHALYLESIFKQMETQEEFLQEMIVEDAEFAKTLQEEEAATQEPTPDLKQIMVEQKEFNKQEQINQKWKSMTPDDIAYRMTKQKLIKSFPTVSSDTLIEVLTAHDNCYQDTVSSLLESGVDQSPDQNENLLELPLSEDTLKEMREAHTATLEENTDAKSSTELRLLSTNYQKRRVELLNKARHYYSRQMNEVAMFYSDLSSKQTLLYEKYKNLAVEQVLRESFDRLQNFDTIDLHHLHVPEAINALDIFLDRNIMLLQGDNKGHAYLMIITGRGKNSPGGIPRIRPAVQKRLMIRGLKCSQLNPGLLRTKIMKTSVMTDKLAQ